MRMNSSYLIILVLLGLLQPVLAATSPQQVAPTTKYSFSATQVFQTTGYYGTTNTTIDPLIYTITFPKPMNNTSYRSGITIQQIYAQIPTNAFNLTFVLNAKNAGNLKFDMSSNTMNNIQTMKIRYLIIASNWISLVFYWFVETPTSSTISSATPYNFTTTGLAAVNMTGTVNSFSCLTGFDVTSTTAANELSLKLAITRASTSSISGTLSSLSTVPINVGYFTFNLLSYNDGQINALPGKITFGFFSANNAGALKYLDISSVVRDYNTLFGLTGFHIVNEAFLSWNGTLTINTSIDISSSNSFKYFQFIYIILEQNWCIEATPYLLISASTCYDICPDGYYPNDLGLTCEICLYDCFQCTNATACSACDSTTHFRQMNASTLRCDPLPGYYDNGLNQIVAIACNPNCQTCLTTSTNCQSCVDGKYLSGTSCQGCGVANCNNCTSSTNCLGCDQLYYLSNSSQTCLPDCSLVANCTICSIIASSILCSGCGLGFAINASSLCIPKCGDSFIIGIQQCDDNNTLSADGCSNMCIIEDGFACSFVNSKSVCVQCLAGTYQSPNKTACLPCAHYDCETCNANGDCLSCSAASNRVLNIITHRCLPKDGYYDDGANQTATLCDPQCLTCSSSGKNSCLSCGKDSLFVQNSCQPISPTISLPQIPQKDSSGINLLYILLPLSLGLLLCCCLIIFCIWRRRKNQENKVQEENEVQIQNNDQNNTKLEETVKVQTLNETKGVFEQKIINNRKAKYRSDSNNNAIKPKKRRAALREQTEENVMSLQEFKDTLQLKNSQNSNNKSKVNDSLIVKDMLVQPSIQQNTLQIQPLVKEKVLQPDLKQKIEQQVKSRSEFRDELSDSNQTKQREELDEQGSRGR